jgi:transketolase N-terminal domain/subunit
MTANTLRSSLAALAAFAMANAVEQLADNATIASRFRALGFTGVKVTGSGATRKVVGKWPGKDTSANMPHQIVAVASL